MSPGAIHPVMHPFDVFCGVDPGIHPSIIGPQPAGCFGSAFLFRAAGAVMA